MINLNVGGIKFTTKLETLKKIAYFANGLTDSDLTEEIFVDRSGKIFDHVLNIFRDPNSLFPTKYKSELDFYDIDYKQVKFKVELTDLIKQLSDKLDQQNDKINQLIDRVNNSSDSVISNQIRQYMVNPAENGDICIFPDCERSNHGNYNYCAEHDKVGMFCDYHRCNAFTPVGVRYCDNHI